MSIYPNDYCHECSQPIPPVEQPAPPPCVGEPCVEIMNASCVKYTGAAIPCKSITSGERLDSIINKLAVCVDANLVRSILGIIRDNDDLSLMLSQITCGFNCGTVTLCAKPAGLSVGTITNTGAVLSWTRVSGAYGYYVRYKKPADATWVLFPLILDSSFAVPTATKPVTGLTALSEYDWEVKTVCNNSGFESGWTNGANFTTLA